MSESGKYSGTISKIIKPVLNDSTSTKPGGTYRDTLSFSITYDDGKPKT